MCRVRRINRQEDIVIIAPFDEVHVEVATIAVYIKNPSFQAIFCFRSCIAIEYFFELIYSDTIAYLSSL